MKERPWLMLLGTTMPPKQADGEMPSSLNTSELRFIKAIFDNMTQKPDADWDKVAVDLSLKDAKCAKERFRQMSVRHGWRSESSSPRKAAAKKAGVAKKPATPRKKKVKVEEEDEDEKPKSEEDLEAF